MFSGIVGIGLAISFSSKNYKIYKKFASAIQQFIINSIDTLINEIDNCKYVQMGFYDVI